MSFSDPPAAAMPSDAPRPMLPPYVSVPPPPPLPPSPSPSPSPAGTDANLIMSLAYSSLGVVALIGLSALLIMGGFCCYRRRQRRALARNVVSSMDAAPLELPMGVRAPSKQRSRQEVLFVSQPDQGSMTFTHVAVRSLDQDDSDASDPVWLQQPAEEQLGVPQNAEHHVSILIDGASMVDPVVSGDGDAAPQRTASDGPRHGISAVDDGPLAGPVTSSGAAPQRTALQSYLELVAGAGGSTSPDVGQVTSGGRDEPAPTLSRTGQAGHACGDSAAVAQPAGVSTVCAASPPQAGQATASGDTAEADAAVSKAQVGHATAEESAAGNLMVSCCSQSKAPQTSAGNGGSASAAGGSPSICGAVQPAMLCGVADGGLP